MDFAKEFPVKKMCKVLEVSRTGYYKWRANETCCKIEILDKQIMTAFKESRRTYGSPRISLALQKQDIKISESTVARRMKALGISPKIKKKFKNTTDSKHDLKVSPNILNREFMPAKLGVAWVSDITYIRVRHSFVYLTTVIDLADRMVVAWSLSDNMTDKHTVINAFKKAIRNRPIVPGLIFHSDRGSQYASDDFRKLLNKEKCIQSMSRKGNCWDNAVAESFFKTIKIESLYRFKFENASEVYSAVFDYIDGWYNTQRIHSSLDGKSPREMSTFLAANDAA